MAVDKLKTEWKSLSDDFRKMEAIHDDYMVKLKELSAVQSSCTKALKHHNYLMNNIKEYVVKAEKEAKQSPEAALEVRKLKEEMELAKMKLKEMQNELPAQSNGFYLNLILGSNLNISLLTKREQFQYKEEYENFKMKITMFIVGLTIVAYSFPFRVLDSILCFLLVWYYCTLTIREAVLRVNGSKIKGWWMIHHYLSCVVPGVVLTWKDGDCYQAFRPFFLAFIAYISMVQLAQNQYQSGCLRRLHSLGQGHQMDITVDGFTSWQFKGLTFLLPFLLSGYIFQLFLTYKLYGFWGTETCDGLWQVYALAILLGVIALGNIWTTSLVCLKKLKTSGSYTQIVAMTRKYSSRQKMDKEEHVE